MQTAAAALQSAVSPLRRREPPPRAERQPQQETRSKASGPTATADDIDNLFNALGELYGNKFSSQWGAFDETGAWRAELQWVPAAHLATGLRRVRQQIQAAARDGAEAWPPMPAAFVALCEPRPEDLGLPTVDAAWREATGNAHQPGQACWSHEAVRLAGADVGWWELTHVLPSRVDRLQRRFERIYQALVNRVMAGEELVPRQLLEHDGSRSPADMAERSGREAATQRAEAEGLPHVMSASQGLAALKAATGRA